MTIALLVQQICLSDHPLLHRRIQSFHGISGQIQWRHSQEQAIAFITKGFFNYFFLQDGRAVQIVVDRQPDGEPFLRAETDAEAPHALLKLPSFQSNPITTHHQP